MGSYCDIESRCVVYVLQEPEDIILEKFKVLHYNIESLMEDYDSDHLLYSLMTLESSIAAYSAFTECFIEEE
jgi:hypothetical protein